MSNKCLEILARDANLGSSSISLGNTMETPRNESTTTAIGAAMATISILFGITLASVLPWQAIGGFILALVKT